MPAEDLTGIKGHQGADLHKGEQTYAQQGQMPP